MTREGSFVFDESGIHQNRVVNDEQGFTNELCCTICQGLLWKPVSCSSCQHLFCFQCIQKWLTFKPTSCPFRCSPYEEKRAPPSIHSLLNLLSIRCRNSLFGCTEILSYSSLENHETIECQFPSKSCSVCGKYILVNEINQHAAFCIPTMIPCSLCQCLIDQAVHQEHTNKCLQERMNYLINRVIPTPHGLEMPANGGVTIPQGNNNQAWFTVLQNQLQRWVGTMTDVELIDIEAVVQARHKNYITRIWSVFRLVALNRSRAIYILFCLLCGGVGNILGCFLLISVFIQHQVNKAMYRSFAFVILFSGLFCFSLPILLANFSDTWIILLTITSLTLWSSTCSDLPLEYYRLGFSSKFVSSIYFIYLIVFKIFLFVVRLYISYIPPYISAGCLAWSTIFVTYNLRFF